MSRLEPRDCRCTCHDTNPLYAVQHAGVPIQGLTLRELQLVAALLPMGKTLTIPQLVHDAWPDRAGLEANEHMAYVVLSRTRKKLQRSNYDIIHNKARMFSLVHGRMAPLATHVFVPDPPPHPRVNVAMNLGDGQ